MPDGRFLSKSIAYSAQVSAVSFEADYLFMRMIAFPDREGRIVGSPRAIKGMCCPLRDEMTLDVIARALSELAGAGLITWYRVGGNEYIAFPGFGNHQRGARLNREAASKIPSPSVKGAALVRTVGRSDGGSTPPNSAGTPPEVRVSKEKGSKGKRSKAKGSKESPNAVASADRAAPTGESKPARKKRETWITPFAEVWEELYGGAMAIEPNLRPLKLAVEKLGAEDALRRWENYLAGNSARFASGARFAATLNEWETPKGGTGTIAVAPETLARAAELFALGRQHGLLTYDGNKATYGAAKTRAAGDARAGATFDADLKASRMWEGLDGLGDGRAIKEIARRLEHAKGAGSNGANGTTAAVA